MIAIIFEVFPKEEHLDDYLDHAARLRPELEQVEGFISVERFRSITDPDKLLSISFFEDEAAVTRWRNLHSHRKTQIAGRAGMFKDYRLRVAEVSRDYGLHDRAEAPNDSRQHHG